MFILVPLILFGWIPLVCVLFLTITPRRAVITSFLGAWMFLPVFGYNLPYLPNYTKVTAANISVLIAAALFDSKTLRSFRPSWFDIPFAIYCITPYFASLSNDLGAYDGLSSMLKRLIAWAIPYFIGRVYFTTLPAARDISIGLVIGGLLYVPLCLWEIRMSPMLHEHIYGFRPDAFYHAVRYGGYRPTVFMQTGLMVGMWMATASIMAFWLWRQRVTTSVMGIPMSLVTAILLVTTVACKSTYAILLTITGLAVMFTSKWLRLSLPMAILIVVPPAYMISRTTEILPKEPLLKMAAVISDERRVESFGSRLIQEDLFTERALEQPLLGWGGYNRFKPDEDDWAGGVDAMWLTTLGMSGITGLVAMNLAWLLPAVLAIILYPARTWSLSAVAPIAGLTGVLVITMCDNLLNSMYNPLMTIIAGGLTSNFLFAKRQGRAAMRPVPTISDHQAMAPRPGLRSGSSLP